MKTANEWANYFDSRKCVHDREIWTCFKCIVAAIAAVQRETVKECAAVAKNFDHALDGGWFICEGIEKEILELEP